MRINKYITSKGEINIINCHQLKENGIHLSMEELYFMGELTYFPENEMLLDKNGNKVEMESVAVALYDFLTGARMAPELSRAMNPEIDRHVELAKSIFKKFHPDKYNLFF